MIPYVSVRKNEKIYELVGDKYKCEHIEILKKLNIKNDT